MKRDVFNYINNTYFNNYMFNLCKLNNCKCFITFFCLYSFGNITSQPVIGVVICDIRYLVILQCYHHVNPICNDTDFLAVQCGKLKT